MKQNSSEAALAAWQAAQRARGGYTEAELVELTDHVRSSAAELVPTDAERVQLASARIGADAELAQEFERVRGARIAALASSPAGLLTIGALLWVLAEVLIRGARFGVVSVALTAFPGATHEAVLVGSIVSLGVVALLAVLPASERAAHAISDALHKRPMRLVGVCSAVAFVALAVHLIGSTWLARIADPDTMNNARIDHIAFLPLAGSSWLLVPLLLLLASRRAVRRAAASQH
jgi:hypothetical protein